MTTEELLVQFGVNLGPLEAGLTKMRAFTKSWAAGMKADLAGAIGRWTTTGLGIGALYKLGEAAKSAYNDMLQISIAEKQIGENANFIQNFNRVIAVAGGNTEEALIAVTKFMQMVGRAQQGDPTAVGSFQKWGLTIKDNNGFMKDQNKILGEVFEKMNKMPSVLERNAMASELFNKNWMTLLPLMQQGSEGVDRLNDSFGNFSESTINTWTNLGKLSASFFSKFSKEGVNLATLGLKNMGIGIASIGAAIGALTIKGSYFQNFTRILDKYYHPDSGQDNDTSVRLKSLNEEGAALDRQKAKWEAYEKRQLSTGRKFQTLTEMWDSFYHGGQPVFKNEELDKKKQFDIEYEKRTKQLAQEKLDLQKKLVEEFKKLHENDPEYIQYQVEMNRLTQEQQTIEAGISDIQHSRMTVGELADRAKKLLGLQNLPTGLNSIFTVTPRMMQALRTSLAEDKSKAMTALGNDQGAVALKSIALQMRNQNPALTLQERQPLREMNNHLQNISGTLKGGQLKVITNDSTP